MSQQDHVTVVPSGEEMEAMARESAKRVEGALNQVLARPEFVDFRNALG